MKRCFLLGLCMMFSTQAFCHQIDVAEPKQALVKNHNDKYYPDPENIYIDRNGIYLNLEGIVHKVSRISTDEVGTYIKKDELIQVDSWRCPRGHANPPWVEKCLTCRWPD